MEQPEEVIKIEVVSSHVQGCVYIGRPSVLGNPFPMHREHERHEVCEQYDKWFKDQLKLQTYAVMQELERLTAKAIADGFMKLRCFCAPRACHGDTLRDYLIEQLILQGYQAE